MDYKCGTDDKRTVKTPNAQHVVWRKRGSGSPESLCEFGSLSPVRTAVEAPPAPSRWDDSRNLRQQKRHNYCLKGRTKYSIKSCLSGSVSGRLQTAGR